MNEELVRQTLRTMRQGTKSMVAQAKGLSVATCRSILIDLLNAGELVELDMEESRGAGLLRSISTTKTMPTLLVSS